MLHLNGIGTAVPSFGIRMQESMETARQFCTVDDSTARIIPVLYRKSGVSHRYSSIFESADGSPFERQSLFHPQQHENDRGPTTAQRMQQYERAAGPLAIQAARRALEQAETFPREITHLITVSCSGLHAPGFDIDLIQALPLSEEVTRTHIGFMGCHAAMNAFRVADAYIGADPKARVLICATELCTLHAQYGWNPDSILTNALFADGAGAVICSANGPKTDWKLRRSGSLLIPDSRDAMTWIIRDHGFEMSLSARVPDLIVTHLKPWLSVWLHRENRSLADIASWAIHPGGPRILQSVGEALNLPPTAIAPSRQILSEFGNMSSPTILFVLERLRSQSASAPVLTLGFGPGLVCEAMLIE